MKIGEGVRLLGVLFLAGAIGGLVGSTADGFSGAMNEYSPSQYMVALQPEGTGPMETKTAINSRQKAKDYIVVAYRNILGDLGKGEGEYLSSLFAMLKIPAADRVVEAKKIRELSEVYPSIPVFADHVVDLYITDESRRTIESIDSKPRAAAGLDSAVVVAKKDLAIAEEAVGREHPDVATILNNLAALYKTQGQYAQAEPLYKRSLAIDEKAYGPYHPDVATDLNNLALLYKTQGQYAQAEPLYKRSLAINERVLGPVHPHVAVSLENMAALLRKTGREKEAEALEKRAAGIRAIKR